MGEPKRIAFGGRKGGIGKTAVTVAVADDLAHRHGLTVLVVDMDPQACATTWLGVSNPDRTMSDVLYNSHVDGALNAAIVETSWTNVWVAPAEEELASREADQAPSKELRLRRVLRTADLSWVDVVLMDCPPSLGPLFVMGLNAAEDLIVVTDSERGGVNGVAKALTTAHIIAEDANPALTVAGIVMNKYDQTTGEHPARWAELAQLYPDYPRWRLPKRAAVANAYGASAPPRLMAGAAPFVLYIRDVVDHLMSTGQHVGQSVT
ncbi:MAG TPA: ParA family protein [Pseudonocardiaceae bacterium]|nr:ParA family protein [Pseudonocardiaceae bacterium]